ncbi:MAG TPA: efflux RND transporter periplasmic adaptor subunit [Chitinophaga sp.]|uniref:efflux RND transporter periplasmic adaptor subunit n=1 Tax=Chitinophaga sp. TaxID=1869181 RepID=UPI002D0901D0|nr:efflux RND transporter periplasmic adaptor subunit [Chitinophaga sp.]HVI48757.1 efflux RND transporter periplasmic adaptor subunit [Chitinophaga sp.]
MRNSYIVSIFAGITLLVGVAACRNKAAQPQHAGHHQPKEPSIDSAVTGLTGAVNARVVATIPAITADSGTRIFTATANGVITYDTRNQTSIASRIGGRIERLLIKYNYQPVKQGQLIMEIYSPDLAAAQRELLYVAHASPDMLPSARQRLLLLGMQPGQVDQVLRTGNILYRVPVYSNSDGYILEKTAAAAAVASTAAASASGGDGMGSMGGGSASAGAATPAPAAPVATPVLLREGQYVSAGQSLFTIYQAKALVAEFAFPAQLSAYIRNGQQLLFFPVNKEDAMESGRIGLIEPVFRNGVNFMLTRVYLGGTRLKVGELLNASVPVVYPGGWWLPEKAVWRSGNKAVVFRQEGRVYVPVIVETGAQAEGMIQVKTNISGWKVASNASYLVDSESFIKTS